MVGAQNLKRTEFESPSCLRKQTKASGKMWFLITANSPHSNDTIGISTKESASITAPAQAGAVQNLQKHYIQKINNFDINTTFKNNSNATSHDIKSAQS